MSREFVSRTREHLIDLMSRPLDDLRPTVVILDGIDLKGRCCIVALGIETGGVKPPLGLWDGSTENAAVATTLLSNLVDRLDVEQSVLVVLDSARAAWAIDDHRRALDQLRGLASVLDRSHSGAAASLREGLEETLTVIRLMRGRLKRTLASTSPCESMIDTVRRVSRDVERWQNGDMCLRWTAAGMLKAEASCARSTGHRDLAKLALAVAARRRRPHHDR